MKRLLSVAALAAVILAGTTGTASARSWRVNNSPNKKAHFLDINAAVASEDVQAGDTVYLDPGCVLNGNQDITKRLVIIGTGYFLSDSPYPEASVASGAFNLRAEGSKAIGVSCKDLYIRANNVTVERCKVTEINVGWNSDYAQYANIRQCYCMGQIKGRGSSSLNSAYCTIENCIVSSVADVVRDLYYPIIRNNYICCSNTSSGYYCLYLIGYGTITNNILLHTISNRKNDVFGSLNNCIVANNILSQDASTMEAAFPDNVALGTHEESAVFSLEGANDQRYDMKDESPAIAIEAGPAFGVYPYVCSGFPVGIPHIVSTTRPTRAINGQVHITQRAVMQNK